MRYQNGDIAEFKGEEKLNKLIVDDDAKSPPAERKGGRTRVESDDDEGEGGAAAASAASGKKTKKKKAVVLSDDDESEFGSDAKESDEDEEDEDEEEDDDVMEVVPPPSARLVLGRESGDVEMTLLGADGPGGGVDRYDRARARRASLLAEVLKLDLPGNPLDALLNEVDRAMTCSHTELVP